MNIKGIDHAGGDAHSYFSESPVAFLNVHPQAGLNSRQNKAGLGSQEFVNVSSRTVVPEFELPQNGCNLHLPPTEWLEKCNWFWGPIGPGFPGLSCEPASAELDTGSLIHTAVSSRASGGVDFVASAHHMKAIFNSVFRPEHNEDVGLALHKVGDVIVIDQVEESTGNTGHTKSQKGSKGTFHAAKDDEQRIHLAHFRLASAGNAVRQAQEEMEKADKAAAEAQSQLAEAMAVAAEAELCAKAAKENLAAAKLALETEYEKVEGLGTRAEKLNSSEVPLTAKRKETSAQSAETDKTVSDREEEMSNLGNVRLPHLQSSGQSSQQNEVVLYSKFLGHTIKTQPPAPPPPSPSSTDDPTEPSMSSSEETEGWECNWLTDPQKTFRQVGVWKIADVSMVLGSDLLILGNQKHPKIALYLQDLQESDEDSKRHLLNYWLENAMAGIPEIAICFHSKGVVQYYELYKTHEILELCGIDATDALTSTLKVLQWLKTSITKEGATYWLTKPKNQARLELFDLSASIDQKASCKVSALDPLDAQPVSMFGGKEVPPVAHPLRASLPIDPFRPHVGLIYYRSAATLLACATQTETRTPPSLDQLHQARRYFKLGIDIMRQTKHACQENPTSDVGNGSDEVDSATEAHLHRSDLLIYVARLGVAHTHLLERTATGGTLPCSFAGCAALSRPPFQRRKIASKPVFSLTGFPALHFVCPALVLPNSVKDQRPTFLEEGDNDKPLFNILLTSLKLLVDLLKECNSEESLALSDKFGEQCDDQKCPHVAPPKIIDQEHSSTKEEEVEKKAYENFKMALTAAFLKTNPALSHSEIAELLKKKWESMSCEERAPFNTNISKGSSESIDYHTKSAETFKSGFENSSTNSKVDERDICEKNPSRKSKNQSKDYCFQQHGTSATLSIPVCHHDGTISQNPNCSVASPKNDSLDDESKENVVTESKENENAKNTSALQQKRKSHVTSLECAESERPVQNAVSTVSTWSHMANNALFYVRQQVACSTAYVLFLMAEAFAQHGHLKQSLEILSLSQSAASKCENPSLKMASHMFRGQEFLCAVHNLAGDIFACLSCEDRSCSEVRPMKGLSIQEMESVAWVLATTEAAMALIPDANTSQEEENCTPIHLSVLQKLETASNSALAHSLLVAAQKQYEAAVRVLPLDLKNSPICHYLLSKVASSQNELGTVLGNRCGALGEANQCFLRARALYNALELPAPAALCAANAGTIRALAADVAVSLLTRQREGSKELFLAQLMKELCTEADMEACAKAEEQGGIRLANLTFLARLGDTALQYLAMAGKLLDKKIDHEAAQWTEYLFAGALSLSTHRLGLCPPPGTSARDLLTATGEMSSTAIGALKKMRSSKALGVGGPLALAHAHLLAARATSDLVQHAQRTSEGIGSLKKKGLMIEAHLESALSLLSSDGSKSSLTISCLVNVEFAKSKQLQTGIRACEARVHHLRTACGALIKLKEIWFDDNIETWCNCEVCCGQDTALKCSLLKERPPIDSDTNQLEVETFMEKIEDEIICHIRQALKCVVQENVKRSLESLQYWKGLYMSSLQNIDITTMYDILSMPK